MPKKMQNCFCFFFTLNRFFTWMDPRRSLVLLAPGSPVDSDMSNLDLPEAAFKRYQFVWEWGEAGLQS